MAAAGEVPSGCVQDDCIYDTNLQDEPSQGGSWESRKVSGHRAELRWEEFSCFILFSKKISVESQNDRAGRGVKGTRMRPGYAVSEAHGCHHGKFCSDV